MSIPPEVKALLEQRAAELEAEFRAATATPVPLVTSPASWTCSRCGGALERVEQLAGDRLCFPCYVDVREPTVTCEFCLEGEHFICTRGPCGCRCGAPLQPADTMPSYRLEKPR